MWKHCWAKKTDRVDTVAVEGFFGADACKALVTFEFLEATEEGFRVRGAKRYLRIAASQSAGGKAASANLKRGKNKPEREPEDFPGLVPATAGEEPERSRRAVPALTPSTEHRAPKEDLPTAAKVLSSSVLKPGKTAAGVEHFPSVAPDPDEAERQLRGDEGSFPPTGLGFCGWWNDARQAQGLSTELFNIAETAQWAERCMAEVGQERFWRAAHTFLDDEFWRPKGWPLSVFRSDQVWRTRANDPPPPKRVRA
jgi:hypothetical protein